MFTEDDRLVTLKEAADELNISIFKLIKLVDIYKIIGLQNLKHGANVYLPHSEVLRVKDEINSSVMLTKN